MVRVHPAVPDKSLKNKNIVCEQARQLFRHSVQGTTAEPRRYLSQRRAPKPKKQRIRWAVAVHEAAHAVVAGATAPSQG